MRIIGIIPARGGSKGIPQKNIKHLAGKPLIVYTIEEALKSKYLDRVVVSTEDEKIADIARKCGAEVLQRPGELAEDHIPVIPHVLKHAVAKIGTDIVVALQPTSPLRKVKYIDLAVEKFLTTKCDWVATVSETRPHPFRMRQMEGDKLIPLFKTEDIWGQRQDFPPIYHLNGAVYVMGKDRIVSEDCFGGVWVGIIMDKIEAIDIDMPLDFLVVERLVEIEERMKW